MQVALRCKASALGHREPRNPAFLRLSVPVPTASSLGTAVRQRVHGLLITKYPIGG
jgi:hypothetical protein